jgi:hypothetical protein
MIGEISFYGVLVPPLLLWALAAMVLGIPLRRALAWMGAYRLVWHRALFDLALFIILLSALDALAVQWNLS